MRCINSIWTLSSIVFLWIWLGTLLPAFAQEGVPFFRNYTAEEYMAHNRNFDVVCDSFGIVYFANFEGIIYYNGAEWNKILTPGISRITRLYIDHQNQIWAGGYNYIGKIISQERGTPALRSYLSDENDSSNFFQIGEVMQIEEKDSSLFFYSKNHQIAIRGDSVLSVQAFEGDREEDTSEKRIWLSDQLIVSTQGTNGLLFQRANGERLFTMTEANGLCSNMINQLAADRSGSVWAATDNGVFRINAPSSFSHFTNSEGLRGEVTALYRHKGLFYAGTLHGLFFYDNTTARFEKFPAITQSCWQLRESPSGDLYAATNNGLFLINGERVEAINDDNTFSLAFDPADSQVCYTGEIDGIYRIKNYKRNPRKERIAEVEKVMKLEFSHDRLWAETLYGELYQLGKDLSIPMRLDSIQGLKSIEENKLYVFDGEVEILSRYGFLQWNPDKQRFSEVASSLDSLIEADNWRPGGLFVSTPPGKQEWITSSDGKEVVVFMSEDMDLSAYDKLDLINDYTIRTVYLEENELAWIGGDFGLLKFDPNKQDDSFAQYPKIYIRSILLGTDSAYFDGNNSDIGRITTLPTASFNSSIKNITLCFSSDANDILHATQYAYYLEGYENRWSLWDTYPDKEYTNLSFGTYTFHVKAKDAYGRESEECTFTFTILKPFYLRWYCLLMYLIAFILLIFLFFKWRTRKLLQENMQLERIVEQRTRQIREQRDEIIEKSQRLEVALKDLSEAQEQLIRQEKVATVGKLTQGLIDRILNPLNYIINFSHLSNVLLKDMKEDVKNEEENITPDNYVDMQDILEMMSTHLMKIEEHGNSTSRILKAMEEMLSDHSCHFANTDINEMIHFNLDVFKNYYQKEIKESTIQIQFEPLKRSLIITADRQQLGRVLITMMQNSLYALRKKKDKIIDFQPQMIIRLEVKGDRSLIRLYDNGIGIEQSIMDKIYDPFFTTKTTSEAAGVGLYLSREIVLSHNGTVEVESKKGEYTEFIISIPMHHS